MADTIFFGEIHEVRKGMWAPFFSLCFRDADWLGSDHMECDAIARKKNASETPGSFKSAVIVLTTCVDSGFLA